MAGNPLGDSILSFAVDLYKELLSESSRNGNTFCSPFSISAALSMALSGARSNTAEELSAVLRVDGNTVHNHFAGFFSKLPGYAQDVRLHIANRMYCEQTYPVLDNYLSLLKDNYEATIVSVDFMNNYESVRKQVNAWVERATQSKITDLLPKGSVNPLTTLILVNAIYFKGLWKSQFNTRSTRRSDFHLDAKNKQEVDMMYQKGTYRMSGSFELDATALEIPYQGGKTSMVVLLPNDVEGLAKLEERLTARHLQNMLGYFHSLSNVELYLPKFRFEQTVFLKNALQAMGINEFFAPNADLSGISEAGNLVPSDVVHKAFVEVNEEGTEAAAATATVMMFGSAPGPMIHRKFVVDHPFMFFICSHDPDVVLFMGSVRVL